jgi:hypothetical protein
VKLLAYAWIALKVCLSTALIAAAAIVVPIAFAETPVSWSSLLAAAAFPVLAVLPWSTHKVDERRRHRGRRHVPGDRSCLSRLGTSRSETRPGRRLRVGSDVGGRGGLCTDGDSPALSHAARPGVSRAGAPYGVAALLIGAFDMPPPPGMRRSSALAVCAFMPVALAISLARDASLYGVTPSGLRTLGILVLGLAPAGFWLFDFLTGGSII